MSDITDAVSADIANERLRSGFRKSAVEAIVSGTINLYTIEGREMPMLADTGTVVVGTVVLWVDQRDPVALGPLRGT